MEDLATKYDFHWVDFREIVQEIRVLVQSKEVVFFTVTGT